MTKQVHRATELLQGGLREAPPPNASLAEPMAFAAALSACGSTGDLATALDIRVRGVPEPRTPRTVCGSVDFRGARCQALEVV